MKRRVNEVLQIMNDSFEDECLELKKKLEDNKKRISIIDIKIDSLNENWEAADSDNIYRKSEKINYQDNSIIKEYIYEKNELVTENISLINKADILEKRISDLQEVISVDRLADSLVLINLQEKERQRIARDLHDFSLQNLTHLIHVIELASLYVDSDPNRTKLELASAGMKLRTIIQDIRNTIYDLRPMEFDDLGFKDAIEIMINKMQATTDIYINLEMENDIEVTNEMIFSNIYRIIKECIINSIKHSEAKEIKIRITQISNLCNIVISDNGKGFYYLCSDENNNFSNRNFYKHFGLQILEERIQVLKGSLDINSLSNDVSGTRIVINIPINDEL